MILGIDASTPGSGGAKRHLIELINNFQPEKNYFLKIKIWGGQSLLDQLQDSEYLIKIKHPLLNKGLFFRVIWQLFYRDNFFRNQFDVLFSPFGTYFGSIKPYVSMSRNMLIFEKKERLRFGLSWIRLKLIFLAYLQKKSFEKAQGLIFISEYAKNIIGNTIDIKSVESRVIHHGVSSDFKFKPKVQFPIEYYTVNNPYKLLYVSAVWVYKHQWNVVIAISNLRKKGYPISVDFVGKAEQESAVKKFLKSIEEVDPNNTYIKWHNNIGLNEVASYYHDSDAFVFASTCENMPNILIEAMSSGLPILCSSFGPMKEFLKKTGVYFDPTSISNLENELEKLLLDVNLREKISNNAFEESHNYNWKLCANQTFNFLKQISKSKNR